MDLTDLMKKFTELNNSDEFDMEPTVVLYDTDSKESFEIIEISTQDDGIFLEFKYSAPISEDDVMEDTDSE